MQNKTANALWALILIGLGGLLLAQNYGYLDQFGWQFWALILGGLGVMFLIVYLVSGVRNWGWLFPALILSAVAATITLGANGVSSAIVAAPIMASVGVPFVVAFALNPREHWWALIPAWIMAVMTVLMWVVDRVPGEAIGSLVMLGAGAPFLLVYALDRKRWWALIPGGVLAGMAVIILLATRTSGEVIGSVVLGVMALPFLAVYAAAPQKNWWALIPAGVFASLAVMVFVITGRSVSDDLGARLSGILFLGVGLTFAVLWLQRTSIPTAWAIYPAAGLVTFAALAFALGARLELVWPLVLIGVGLVLLLVSLRPRHVG
jgi:hypothetical protein